MSWRRKCDSALPITNSSSPSVHGPPRRLQGCVSVPLCLTAVFVSIACTDVFTRTAIVHRNHIRSHCRRCRHVTDRVLHVSHCLPLGIATSVRLTGRSLVVLCGTEFLLSVIRRRLSMVVAGVRRHPLLFRHQPRRRSHSAATGGMFLVLAVDNSFCHSGTGQVFFLRSTLICFRFDPFIGPLAPCYVIATVVEVAFLRGADVLRSVSKHTNGRLLYVISVNSFPCSNAVAQSRYIFQI